MSSSAPARRLRDLTAAAQAAGTAASLSLSIADLGTVEEVAEHAHELAVHPLAPFAAAAIADAGATGAGALLAFAAALPGQRSLLALQDTCEVLLADDGAVRVAGGALHDALLPSRADRVREPLLAAARLEAVLRLALLGARPPWALLAALTQDVTDLPEEHLDRLARLIGVFLDTHEPSAGRADLLAQLGRLRDLDADDALAELGVQALRDAVSLTDPDEVRDAVVGAAGLLGEAAERDGGREDCAALAECAMAVVAFADRDAAAVRACARRALAASETLALHLRGTHRRPWTAPRRAAQGAWLSLAAALDASAVELEHDAFLDTTEAVVALAEAYGDLRTVSPAGHAAARLARPRIEADVARRSAMLAQVGRAVALDAGRDRPLLPSGAAELLAAARGRADAPAALPDGDEPAEPDPAAGSAGRAALEEVVGVARADALLREHPGAGPALEDVAAVLRADDLLSLLADRDPVLVLLEERLLADLGANDRFVGRVREDFWRLARLTVRFVRHTLDSAVPYLRPYGDRSGAPRERALQEHYAQWLALVLPRVHLEVRDLGGGRGDVLVGMGHGSEFAVEVKREFADAGREAVEAAYLGQALEYQVTGPPLGGLLVLDLTPHEGVTPHVTDLLWVAHRRPGQGSVLRTALCGVVVGNRPPPSQVVAGPG